MEYIIALGNGLDNRKDLTVESKMTALAATVLYKHTTGSKIIFSGGFTKGKINGSEAKKMYEYSMVLLNIKNGDVILEQNSVDTVGNVEEVKKYLTKDDNVTLVSFGFHLKRAKKLFERYGIKVAGSVASEKILSENFYQDLIKNYNLKRKTIKLLREVILLSLVYTIDNKGRLLRIISSKTRG